jgi:hypothetical protein
MTLRLRHLMALVAVIAVGLSLFLWSSSGPLSLWVGGFPLEVALEDRSGRSVIGVAVQQVAQMADAEFLVAHPESPDLFLEEADWVADQVFTVRVRCHGASMPGREVSYSQCRALVVRIDYADSTHRLLSVAIPDGRIRRRVSVLVP